MFSNKGVLLSRDIKAGNIRPSVKRGIVANHVEAKFICKDLSDSRYYKIKMTRNYCARVQE